MRLKSSIAFADHSSMRRMLPLLLLLAVFAEAQKPLMQTPESATAQLINDIKSGCEAKKKRDSSYYKLPPPSEQLVYVLNGKKHSEESLLESARRSQITKCSTDEIEVTFPATFPSSAIVTTRFQEEGVFSGTHGKSKTFSVYAKYTYEYANSKWIIRKLEAITAK